VWCLALLDEPVELPGDDSPTLPYLAITNRHDGTAACALRATAVRIVCANTFRAAELEGERTGATFSFIHKSSWRSRIEEARRAVTGARSEIRRYTELAHELLAIPVSPKQRELFVTEFIPMPPAGLVTDRVARNVEEARSALRLIFESKTSRGDRGQRLWADASRGRVPRPRPNCPVVGDPAQPDPDPARAAQAPGLVADPRSRRSGMTTSGVPQEGKPGAPRPITQEEKQS
jgi:hypothetical protein